MKTYCYKSIIETIESFLGRKGFKDKMNHWQKRQQCDGMMGDVYDGNVWKDFQSVGGAPFLSSDGIGLLLKQ